jgi:hypothetical protein
MLILCDGGEEKGKGEKEEKKSEEKATTSNF